VKQLSIDDKILGKKQSPLFYIKWGFKIAIVLVISIVLWFNYITIESITDVRISSLEVKDGKFLILTNKGAFKNVDSMMHFKTRSADIQGKAVPGDIVTITVYGVRIGIFSMYKNVLNIKHE